MNAAKSRREGTNPIGKGTKNLTVNISKDLHAALTKLANDQNISLKAYLKDFLEVIARRGLRIETKVIYALDANSLQAILAHEDFLNLAKSLATVAAQREADRGSKGK